MKVDLFLISSVSRIFYIQHYDRKIRIPLGLPLVMTVEEAKINVNKQKLSMIRMRSRLDSAEEGTYGMKKVDLKSYLYMADSCQCMTKTTTIW